MSSLLSASPLSLWCRADPSLWSIKKTSHWAGLFYARRGLKPSSRLLESENAAGCQPLNGADADDVAEAGGAEHGSVAHATEERCVGEFGALVGVLDGCLADANGDDIAHNHHQRHFRRPGEGGGSDGQKRGEHANPEETLHLQV